GVDGWIEKALSRTIQWGVRGAKRLDARARARGRRGLAGGCCGQEYSCTAGRGMNEQSLLGPTSHSFISQRLRLHYVDWGNAEAPPLILVHGGQDHCRNWDWVAEDLRRDYHIIAPDLRG